MTLPILQNIIPRFVLLLTSIATSCFAQEEHMTYDVPSWVYTPDEIVFGITQAEWGEKWIDYLLAFDCETFPVLSATGEGAEQHQEGTVFFLSGAVGGKLKRKVTVEYGKSIFVPVITYFNHYPCPYPNFKPAPGQSMKDFLIQGGAEIINGASAMKVVVDGDTLNNVTPFRFTSDLFYLKGNPELVCVDLCITTGPQPSIIDGYWVILKPLPKGKHEIWFYGEVPGQGMVVDVGYEVLIK